MLFSEFVGAPVMPLNEYAVKIRGINFSLISFFQPLLTLVSASFKQYLKMGAVLFLRFWRKDALCYEISLSHEESTLEKIEVFD